MAIGVETAVDDVDPFLLHVSYLTYFGELYRELRRVYEEPNPHVSPSQSIQSLLL